MSREHVSPKRTSPRLTPTLKTAAWAWSRQPAFWITVWQFGSGMEHLIPEVWDLPAIQSYCLYSCTHIMDPPDPPCTDTGCAWSYHTSDKNILLAQSFCWLGYCVFDARGQCIYPLRSFWCRTLLWRGSVSLGKRRLCGTYLQRCGCPGDFLGINRGKKGLWACLKRGSSWTVVLRLRCLNLFVDYTLVIWSRTLQKYPCLCPL